MLLKGLSILLIAVLAFSTPMGLCCMAGMCGTGETGGEDAATEHAGEPLAATTCCSQSSAPAPAPGKPAPAESTPEHPAPDHDCPICELDVAPGEMRDDAYVQVSASPLLFLSLLTPAVDQPVLPLVQERVPRNAAETGPPAMGGTLVAQACLFLI